MNWLLIVLGLILVNSCVGEEPKCDGPVIACYYASWSYYRTEVGHYNISHIDPNLCTHLIYTFSGLNVDGKIDSLDPNYDVTKGGYQYFNSLKQINPCLKTLLAIGGWNDGSRKYSVMASSEDSRKVFIESALRYIVTYNFDGLDIDWEYPANRGGIAEDKENFSLLVKEMKERFSKWNLLLTIAAPISQYILEKAYDIAAINKYIDYVFLMAYDYTPTDSNVTGLIAPLDEIKKTVEFWLSKQFDKKKLVLGMPSYARTFVLDNEDDHDLGALTEGPGLAGPYTKEAGFLSYYELQINLASQLYEENVTDNGAYGYYSTEWMSYDTLDHYIAKTKYALDMNLGGVMLWSIDTDDFTGFFGPKNIILTTLYNTTQDYVNRHIN
ncbi:PREDICTED: acidic mammalian chitinase-like [Nicrophorus vespilloides]|uniref:Acidic mammalian chitinase-like n=1 Tax=Nicrophorus vespilloides TaxID=110193 RepID=A0ABM1MWW2_NICVS|nr:PREDICTED: acidic mammalian chitinase-like [Nicrophorus vespilloides]